MHNNKQQHYLNLQNSQRMQLEVVDWSSMQEFAKFFQISCNVPSGWGGNIVGTGAFGVNLWGASGVFFSIGSCPWTQAAVFWSAGFLQKVHVEMRAVFKVAASRCSLDAWRRGETRRIIEHGVWQWSLVAKRAKWITGRYVEYCRIWEGERTLRHTRAKTDVLAWKGRVVVTVAIGELCKRSICHFAVDIVSRVFDRYSSCCSRWRYDPWWKAHDIYISFQLSQFKIPLLHTAEFSARIFDFNSADEHVSINCF